MKANAVFVHQRHSRVALQAAPTDFFAIETTSRSDVQLTDQVTGDLAPARVKWFFNVTRGTLIKVKVLGRYTSLQSAISATAR